MVGRPEFAITRHVVHGAEPKKEAVLELHALDVTEAHVEPFGATEAEKAGHVPNATVPGGVGSRYKPNVAVALPRGMGLIVPGVGAAAVAAGFPGVAAGSAPTGLTVGPATGEATPVAIRAVPEMGAAAAIGVVAGAEQTARAGSTVVVPRVEPVGPGTLLGAAMGPTSVERARTRAVTVRAAIPAAGEPLARPVARKVRATTPEVAGRMDTCSAFPETEIRGASDPAAPLVNSVLHVTCYS